MLPACCNRGWLADVQASASYTASVGTTLDQSLHASYRFDAAGNRVRVRTESDTGDAASGLYAFDANNRMLSGRDDKLQPSGQTTATPDQTLNAFTYDGHGNRLTETRESKTTTYTYDELNRVVASVDADGKTEAWGYDANGNAITQRTRDGVSVATTYNAENRATVTRTTGADGKVSTSTNTSDAIGNIMRTRVESKDSAFTETTKRDVRYLEQSKTISESRAKGAAGLSGATSFQYDANGNLAFLDRGQRQTGGNAVASFDYDLEGHIIGRADTATLGTSSVFFEGYLADPDAQAQLDETYGTQSSVADQVRLSLFGGAASTSSRLQSYLYANNKSIAEADGTQTLKLEKLTLTGGDAVTEDVTLDDGTVETNITR